MKSTGMSARIGHLFLRSLYLVASCVLVVFILLLILNVFPGSLPTIPFLISLFVSFYLHIVVHFLGHCLFGNLTGLKLISFSLLNKTYVKEGNRFVVRPAPPEVSLCPCLMVPRKLSKSSSYTTYWLGGVFFNFLTASVALIIAIFLLQLGSTHFLIHYAICFLLAFFAVGFVKTCMEGLPSWKAYLPNDAMAAWYLHHDPLSADAFQANMKILNMMAKGRTPGCEVAGQVIDEWHLKPEDTANPFVMLMVLRQSEILQWHMEYKAADNCLALLFEKADSHPEEWQERIMQDCIFALVLQRQNAPLVDELLTEDQIRRYENMASAESLRCLYAWSLWMNTGAKASSEYEGAAFRAANNIAFRPAAEGWKQVLADLTADN